MKNKTVEKLMRFLITLLGAGIGAALAALILPLFSRWYPLSPYAPIALYAALCLIAAAVCFAFSSAIIGRTMKLITAIERRWDAMPTQQIVLTSIGMIMGLVVAALITQLILSAGASLITISFSTWGCESAFTATAAGSLRACAGICAAPPRPASWMTRTCSWPMRARRKRRMTSRPHSRPANTWTPRSSSTGAWWTSSRPAF